MHLFTITYPYLTNKKSAMKKYTSLIFSLDDFLRIDSSVVMSILIVCGISIHLKSNFIEESSCSSYSDFDFVFQST